MDLRLPLRPQRVVPRERSVAMLGGLEYREIAEAWPCGTEGMRWRGAHSPLAMRERISCLTIA